MAKNQPVSTNEQETKVEKTENTVVEKKEDDGKPDGNKEKEQVASSEPQNSEVKKEEKEVKEVQPSKEVPSPASVPTVQSDVQVSDVQPVTESDEEVLAQRLGIRPVTDVTTGNKSYPSTPAMRAYAERQAQLEAQKMVNKAFDLASIVKQKYNETVAKHPTVKYLVTFMEEYVQRMTPDNSIDEQTGGQYQTKLARLYDTILAQEPELAHICLNIVVSAIKEELNKTFSPLHALRFANTAVLNPDEALRFQMLTTTFIALAEGTPKSKLEDKISVKKLLNYVPDRNAKSNLADFLN